MEDRGVFPGAMALASPVTTPSLLGCMGCAAKSSIWLLRRIPVPRATRQLPKAPLRVVVRDTAFPQRSSTERWVVFFRSVPSGGAGLALVSPVAAGSSAADGV